MIDPVMLYQTALRNEGNKGISEETIYQTRLIIDENIKSKAAHRFNVVDKPGLGVARISIAITGAEVEGEGFKPRNLVPISAVLTVAQKATGLDSKTAVLVVEAKLRDSVTGKLLGEGVYTMSSDTFRMESGTRNNSRNWPATGSRRRSASLLVWPVIKHALSFHDDRRSGCGSLCHNCLGS